MSDRISELEKRLADLEADIAETEARLPAHSVKPPVMRDLFALEDERESLRGELRRLKALRNHAD
ncbi:MAG: hypothetical protein LJE64_15275 [Desulfofustis sp.]|jgi:uncharacterized small protein (DUF1192 family)|nr:hypothetical protein [Desulfofustis sp.]